MKSILWVTNVILPEANRLLGHKVSPLGGWLNNSSRLLAADGVVKLYVASPYEGKKVIYKDGETITYIYFPSITKYKAKTHEIMFSTIISNINPSLVHLFGSEIAHSYLFMKVAKAKNIPVAVNLQGIVTEIAKVHHAFLPRSATFWPTLRSILRRDGINRTGRLFKLRGEYERLLLQKADYIIGRTKWDYRFIKDNNFPGKYLAWNETLRPLFYENTWSNATMKPYTLFISQANYSVKGLHLALEALVRVKKVYPSVHLYIAGTNIINQRVFHISAISQYGSYIKRQLKKLNLASNVTFLGLISEREMVSNLLSANAFILPSLLENSPNSLGEAMLIGTPSIASRVGGTPEYIENGRSGFLYDALDIEGLAELIIDVFQMLPEQLMNLSNAARKSTHTKYNLSENHETLKMIYHEILGEY